MKRSLLVIAAILVTLSGHSQVPTIPNGSFENWIDSATYKWPAGWEMMFFEDVSYGGVTQQQSASEGQYSIKLKPYLYNGYVQSIYLNTITRAELTSPVGGIAFDYKAFNTTFWDGFRVQLDFYDMNSNFIIYKKWDFPGNASNFTPASLFFNIPNAKSYEIKISFTTLSSVEGPYCLIDNFHFLGVGLSELSSAERTLVFPCPATDHAVIQNPFSERCQYKIHSMTGEQIHSGTIEDHEVVLNTNDIAPGIYIVTLNDPNTMTTAKLIKN